MKRFNIFIITIAICGIAAMAQNRPDVTHQSTGDDRNIHKFVADMPTLSYNEEAREITVQGSQSDFYTVSIIVQSSQAVVLETVIDGTFDIIDVSMLESSNYNIALTSSNSNTYSWTFNVAGGFSAIRINDKSSSSSTVIGTNDKFKTRE